MHKKIHLWAILLQPVAYYDRLYVPTGVKLLT